MSLNVRAATRVREGKREFLIVATLDEQHADAIRALLGNMSADKAAGLVGIEDDAKFLAAARGSYGIFAALEDATSQGKSSEDGTGRGSFPISTMSSLMFELSTRRDLRSLKADASKAQEAPAANEQKRAPASQG